MLSINVLGSASWMGLTFCEAQMFASELAAIHVRHNAHEGTSFCQPNVHSKVLIRIETLCKTGLVSVWWLTCWRRGASPQAQHSPPTDSMSETCLNSQMSFNEASPYERFIQNKLLAYELDPVNSISELLLGLIIRCVFNPDCNQMIKNCLTEIKKTQLAKQPN